MRSGLTTESLQMRLRTKLRFGVLKTRDERRILAPRRKMCCVPVSPGFSSSGSNTDKTPSVFDNGRNWANPRTGSQETMPLEAVSKETLETAGTPKKKNTHKHKKQVRGFEACGSERTVSQMETCKKAGRRRGEDLYSLVSRWVRETVPLPTARCVGDVHILLNEAGRPP